ncbi:hypothetical protein ACFOY8_13310 [Thalassospira xianhensis]|uniref:Uncharacterized protein n=1 Tax=Thalassospira xianhensis MCCC 1A02616 TaxID=1177929 RepID=A0A367UHP5_9PROT|nr:hypothetical protein [Thalassospira xianhensis]RCK07826.1 hypothetical protein TH5_01980 [Thalassospira xianhensis MCCC 1A02616]
MSQSRVSALKVDGIMHDGRFLADVASTLLADVKALVPELPSLGAGLFPERLRIDDDISTASLSDIRHLIEWCGQTAFNDPGCGIGFVFDGAPAVDASEAFDNLHADLCLWFRSFTGRGLSGHDLTALKETYGFIDLQITVEDNCLTMLPPEAVLDICERVGIQEVDVEISALALNRDECFQWLERFYRSTIGTDVELVAKILTDRHLHYHEGFGAALSHLSAEDFGLSISPEFVGLLNQGGPGLFSCNSAYALNTHGDELLKQSHLLRRRMVTDGTKKLVLDAACSCCQVSTPCLHSGWSALPTLNSSGCPTGAMNVLTLFCSE